MKLTRAEKVDAELERWTIERLDEIDWLEGLDLSEQTPDHTTRFLEAIKKEDWQTAFKLCTTPELLRLAVESAKPVKRGKGAPRGVRKRTIILNQQCEIASWELNRIRLLWKEHGKLSPGRDELAKKIAAARHEITIERLKSYLSNRHRLRRQ